jgi:hypothetical protein
MVTPDRFRILKTVHTVLHSSLPPSVKELFISETMQKLNIPKDCGLQESIRIMKTFYGNKKIVNRQISKIEQRFFQWIAQKNFSNPPPDPSVFKGNYIIGKVVGNNADASIDISQQNNLSAIFSKSGGGKTNTLYNLVDQAVGKITKSGDPMHIHVYEMAKRESIYLVSRHPDFLVLNPFVPFNIFYPPCGVDFRDYNSIVFELSCQELGIRHETAILLEEEHNGFCELKEVTPENLDDTCPTLPEFVDYLYEKFLHPQTREDKNNRGAIATALKHFRPLCRKFRQALNVRRGILQGQRQKLSDHNIVFEMGWPGLTSREKRLFTKLRVRYSRLEKEIVGEASDIELLIIFEESKYILGTDRVTTSGPDYMKQEIDEDRAIGIAFIAMSQHIEDFADFVKNSTAYCVCLPLGKLGIQSAARAMECSEFDIRRLHIPYGIMNIPTHPGGFKIKIPKSPIRQKNKAAVERIAREKRELFMENVIYTDESPADKPEQDQTAEKPQKPVEIKVIGKALEELAGFLYYIRENPAHKNLSSLYDSYGIGREKGTRLKNDLLDNGLVEQIKIMDGSRKRPSIRLRITESGHQWLSKTLNENA